MSVGELNPPNRILLGPGPSNIDPRVFKALSSNMVGYMDPYFMGVMNDVQELLRYVFQTKNKLTLPISGTGMAGMEASFCNIVEEGDEVIVGANGFFGERMCEIVSRLGGKVIRVEEEWGRVVAKEAVEKALKNSGAKVVALVHGETSTGTLQPLKEIGRLAKSYDALLVVDAVTSLSGCELPLDDWNVDVCYSGTQKCLNCPPGLAPVSFSEKAVNAIQNRKKKVSSFYFDISLIGKYWSEERVYHHTAPISMIYALREALRIVKEEVLENRWKRHLRNSQALMAGVEALGLKMFAQEGHRLPSLNTVTIPDGVSDSEVRKMLLADHNIEIGGGLGALRGKIWRIGLMGLNSSEKNVTLVLEALERALKRQGRRIRLGSGVGAAMECYDSS